MQRHRMIVIGTALAALLAACGGRADVEVTTVEDVADTSDFGARQTELAAEAATRAASQPTATRTATALPRPTRTPLPTGTPAPTGLPPAGTSEATRDSAVGPPDTPTPSPTLEDVEMAQITGCGTEPLSIPLRDEETVAAVDEWQRMGAASTAIFDAWDAFFAIIDEMFLYNEVVNNTEVFEGAATFTSVAESQLPTLRELPEDSPFYTLVQTIIGMTEDQVEMAGLLTRAGQEHDPTYWDQALAISATFDEQGQIFDEQFTAACDYWVGQR